ncbi:2-hydroxyacid dehydrogenase [Bacillaceae bacterium W0354]
MSKPYVFVTRQLPDDALRRLKDKFNVNIWPYDDVTVDRDTLIQEAGKADALLTTLSDRIDEELLSYAKNVKVIANLAVGFDNIDIAAAKKFNVVITNTPDVLNDTTADLTFALLLATARRLPESVDYVKDGKWTSWSPLLLAGSDVHHKTIGIVGMGSIGEAIAKRATGFDMNIIYHNRSRKVEAEERLGAQYVTFNKLLRESDFVVCMTPLTDETKGMFNAEAFNQMKKSAIFINTSRGAVVDEVALYEALKTNQIKAAGLDVFINEPISNDHPLLQLDNVVALPHIGSSSIETRYAMMELAENNIISVLEGKAPITPVIK